MNITFFIGNGFDINLGLKTKYVQFYPYFIKYASYENMIKNWINGNELFWSDLEEKLGQQLERLFILNQDSFYNDKDELDRLLLEYLESEQSKFLCDDKKDIIIKEMQRSLMQLDRGLSENDKTSINATLKAYRDSNYTYEFISFNYTNTLDRIVKLVKENNKIISTHTCNSGNKNNIIGNVLHIHGTIDEEMILGVNDIEQINCDFLKNNEDFQDTFIKLKMNNALGQRKTEKVNQIIENSHIICIFGMSIGNTDKHWWQEIIKWLFHNSNNKLILYIFGFENELRKKLPSTVIRLNKKLKKIFFEQGKGDYTEEDYEKIKDRIIISFNANMFNFPKVNDNIDPDTTL